MVVLVHVHILRTLNACHASLEASQCVLQSSPPPDLITHICGAILPRFQTRFRERALTVRVTSELAMRSTAELLQCPTSCINFVSSVPQIPKPQHPKSTLQPARPSPKRTRLRRPKNRVDLWSRVDPNICMVRFPSNRSFPYCFVVIVGLLLQYMICPEAVWKSCESKP